MRLATVRTPDGGRTAARVDGDEVVALPYADLGALLAEPDWHDRAADRLATGPRSPYDESALDVPVPRPAKVVCVGLNYRTHIREMGRELPTHPTLFAKYAVSLVGPRDDVALPPESDQVDWEAELGVVIGAPIRRATPEQARAAIAGYTVVNDVSMRDWQWRTPQWLSGKTFERSTPVGPVLVTADEVVGDDPDLLVTCSVDGEVMQSARTSDLVFSPADVVAHLSTIMTLEPGDLIATGTPGGVGSARDPKVFLHPGQVLRTEVEGIGACENRCVPG